MKQAEKETGYVLRWAYPILFLIGNHLIDLVGCFIRFFGNDVIEGKDLICICFKLIRDDREGVFYVTWIWMGMRSPFTY